MPYTLRIPLKRSSIDHTIPYSASSQNIGVFPLRLPHEQTFHFFQDAEECEHRFY